VVWVLTASSNLVLKVLRFRASDQQHVTTDDVRALIAQATATGAVHEDEEEILGRVLHLGDRPVAAVMTPRTSVSWVPVNASAADLRQLVLGDTSEWVLICERTIDDVIGVVRIREVLRRMVAGERCDLRASAQTPLFVPEALTMLQLMESLRSSHVPAAVVLDEFGGIEGMVTFVDLVTHLVGDLASGPGLDGVADIVRRPDGTWLINGSTAFEEMEEALGIEPAAAGARRDYHTVAGLVLDELGRLPVAGESVLHLGFRFEVVQMEGQRIARIAASPERREER
jgi:putative hemolysin